MVSREARVSKKKTLARLICRHRKQDRVSHINYLITIWRAKAVSGHDHDQFARKATQGAEQLFFTSHVEHGIVYWYAQGKGRGVRIYNVDAGANIWQPLGKGRYSLASERIVDQVVKISERTKSCPISGTTGSTMFR